MEAVIDQSLGDVEGMNAHARLSLVCENHFVHWWSAERFVVIAGQAVGDVTSVQNGSFSRFAQAVVAVGLNISQSPQHHSVVTKESFYPAD